MARCLFPGAFAVIRVIRVLITARTTKETIAMAINESVICAVSGPVTGLVALARKNDL
jgi:hypothetical protein